MKPPTAISAIFQKPFDEALAFFRAKVPLPTQTWQDVAEDYQALAFTIAGITQLNILKDAQEAITQQLEKGISPEQFREQFQEIMTRRGWNPNFSPKRIDLILTQNIRNAHQYGRFTQMRSEQMMKRRPYWQWVHGDSPNPRPHHQAQDGKVYPADADIWKAIHPSPFGCFVEGTLVATSNGWKPIELIRVGDRVLGGSGNCQNVSAVHKLMYADQVVRVSCKGVGETLATPNHRFLTLRGWIRADQLTLGDILVQTPQLATKNTGISNVNQVNSFSCNSFMSSPAKRVAPITSAFNSNLLIGQVQVNPIPVNTMVEDNLQPHSDKVSHQSSFGTGGTSSLVKMLVGVNMDSQAGMFPFSHVGFFDFGKRCSRLLSPMLIVNPLQSNSFTSLSGFYSNQAQQLRDGAIADFPSLTKHADSARLLDVQLVQSIFECASFSDFNILNNFVQMSISLSRQGNVAESPQIADSLVGSLPSLAELAHRYTLLYMQEPQGFASGAPLDTFDTLEQFRAWAIHNAISHPITSLTKEQYIGSVYDITIDVDASYCLRTGIVHNCRCRAFPLSQRDLDREGLTVSEPPSLSSIAEKGFTKGFSNDLESQRLELVEQALDALPPNLRRFLEEIEYLEFYDPSQPRDRAGRFARKGIAAFTPSQAKKQFGVDVEDSIATREDRLRTELIEQLSPKVEAGIKSSVDRVFDDAKKDYLDLDNKDKIDRLESYIDEAKRFASGRLDEKEQKQFLNEYDDLIKDFKSELLSLNQAVGDDEIDELDSVSKFLEGRKKQYERKKRRAIAGQISENENFIAGDANRNLDDTYQALKKDPFNEDRQGDFLYEAEFATDLHRRVMGEMSSNEEAEFDKNYQSKLEKYSKQIEFLKNHSTEDDLDGFLGELSDGAESLMAQFDDITTTNEDKEKARKIIRDLEIQRETKNQKIKNLRDESAALEQKSSRWDAKYKRIASKADEMSALANSLRGEEANKMYKRVNNIYRALNGKVGSRREKLQEESRTKRNELREMERQ